MSEHNCQNIALIFQMKEELLKEMGKIKKQLEAVDVKYNFLQKEQNGQKMEIKQKISREDKEEIIEELNRLYNLIWKLIFVILTSSIGIIFTILLNLGGIK